MARETGAQRRERQRQTREEREQQDAADTNREEALGNLEQQEAVERKVSYSFSGKFGSTPSSQLLQYPKDRKFADHSDYVKFRFVKYTPPFAASNSNNYISATGDGVSGESVNIYNNSIAGFEETGLPSIVMYMPEDIGAEYGATWGGKGFTNTGADLMKGFGSFANAESPQAGAGKVAQVLGNVMQRGDALIADAVAQGINKLPGKIGGSVDINDVLGGVGGVILNPNAELLFSGFDLRSFGLNFKMSPKNGKEAEMIRDIVTTFKKASLPSLGAKPSNTFKNVFKNEGPSAEENKNNSNYIGVPNFCIVEFMKGKNQHPYLTQFKPCAITSVKVSYTPDGQYSTYSDGSPVATQLTLAFTESKLVYSNEISYGGASY